MPPADVSALLGPPFRVIVNSIDPTLTESELAQIEKAYRSGYDSEGWRETVLFEGVAQTLQEMQHARMHMFVVTNKPRTPTLKILTHLGILHLFEEIVTRDSRTPGYGSKAEMVSPLLRHHQLSPGSTIFVGDTAEDQEAATANHLEFVHVKYGYGSINAACRSITCFSELCSVLPKKDTAERA